MINLIRDKDTGVGKKYEKSFQQGKGKQELAGFPRNTAVGKVTQIGSLTKMAESQW